MQFVVSKLWLLHTSSKNGKISDWLILSIHWLSVTAFEDYGGNYPSSYWAKGAVDSQRVAVYSRDNPESQTQKNTKLLTAILTPLGNLESSVNLTWKYLDCVRKPEYPEETHASMGRRCKLHKERLESAGDWNQRPFSCDPGPQTT